MDKRNDLQESLPHGPLHEAIEITREGEQDNLSLHFTLQKAMKNPFRGALRKAAVDPERINKLRAPRGLGDANFVVHTTKQTQ